MPEDEEDLPPAYTPAADPALGEETIEVGPRRPFQPPSQPAPMPTPPDVVLSPPTDRLQWHQAPGQAYRSSPSQPQSQTQPYAPQHHTWSSSRMYTSEYPQWRRAGNFNSGGGLIGSLVDTVREIFDAVSSTPHDSASSARQVNRGAYASSYAPSAQSCAPQAAPAPTPRPMSQPNSPASRPDVLDDGRPTREPVPGHPLLRDGMLLVYPKSHTCWKCHNTGYKDYDPSRPCRKCWDKYGKPYTGALTYAPWPSSDSTSNSRMQRPLPHHHSQTNLASGCHPNLFIQPPRPSAPHLRSVSEPPPLSPLPSSQTPTPTPQGNGPSYYIYNPLLRMGSSPPVPHARPIPPGDPRLGGQKCLKCQGTGVNAGILFNLTACQRCGGVGRVWT